MTIHLSNTSAKDGGGITIANGVYFNDTSGTGAGPFNLVETIIDSTGAEILGTKADVANTFTNSTAISIMSVLKQLSVSLQAMQIVLAPLVSTSNALNIYVAGGGNLNGRAMANASAPVVQCSQAYTEVGQSQTATILGSTGNTADWLDGLVIVPGNTSPGSVILLDLAATFTIFAGGSNSVTTLIPFFVPISSVSKNGAWKVTTGANVSVFAMGDFT